MARVRRRRRAPLIARAIFGGLAALLASAPLVGESSAGSSLAQVGIPYDAVRPERAAEGAWLSASIGQFHTVAVAADGGLWAWGAERRRSARQRFVPG